MKPDNFFKIFSLSFVWIWLVIFSLIPYGLVIIASFLSHDDNHLIQLPITFSNYAQLNNITYLTIFEKSFYLAGVCTLICLILGYPFAYAIARMKTNFKGLLLLLIIIPFWTSSLIRTYSMITILKPKGIINSTLVWLGLIDKPISMLFNNSAVLIGLVYNLLPFMILPLMTNIERLDNRLVDAARDLGANRITTFRKIILPLTMPGIISGCILVFLPAMTIFYIPDLLGGSKSMLLGNLIQNQFLVAQNWPLGSAISIVLAVVLALLILIYWRSTHGKKSEIDMKKITTPAYLTVIYLFFYIPIIVLIIYSFNNAQYSLIWHGFSLRWYHNLFADKDLWIAVAHSLVLGITAATAAMCIGGLAGVSLYRYKFFGRNFLYGLIFILILSPEIVMGISLLILFSTTQVTLGFWTLLFAHTTFCIPFVVVTVYSRIVSFDKYIFEAAKDLGAKDGLIFVRIILPLLWPALLAGWLLSFTLSLDDVITSYFVAGPDYEILPLKIYSMVRLGVKPEINALCSVTFTFTLIMVVLSQFALRKKP